ncbi:prepilin-type N-terminal cleavage/methylation domain-containing protein [Salibacterium salarium]|uniref:type IV pilus modification PilV family protein n=1 Tax=Salibacterium salarium TaxID=284579 RepID=UPI0027876BAC|nr:prepilin-type N-terminal cleavage/methylation domain-containing protein [Salibacterium salarium]MDQ0300214.1 prepilin-type N-terminal cleavage/methylation domain-containing protein [Salibacterium salarium]
MKNQNGLTLVEVLASITILSIVILTFLSFFSQSMIFSQQTEDNLTAVNAAEKEMTRIKYNPPEESECPGNVLDVNDKQYYSCVELSTDNNELTNEANELGLHLVHVKIYTDSNFNPDSEPQSELYGYIEVEQ